MLEQGLFLPTLGHRRDSLSPTGMTPGHDLLVLLARAPQKLERLVTRNLQEARQKGARTLLMTTENLTHPENLGQLQAFSRNLETILDRAGVSGFSAYLMTRDPQSWLRSYYNELVLDGRSLETRSFEKFSSALAAEGTSYGSVLETCMRAFGDHLVKTPPVDEGIESVLDHFAKMTGVRINVDVTPRERQSPSLQAVEEIRQKNMELRTSGPGMLFTNPRLAARAASANLPQNWRRTIRQMRRSIEVMGVRV